jgi:hypothetical protein
MGNLSQPSDRTIEAYNKIREILSYHHRYPRLRVLKPVGASYGNEPRATPPPHERILKEKVSLDCDATIADLYGSLPKHSKSGNRYKSIAILDVDIFFNQKELSRTKREVYAWEVEDYIIDYDEQNPSKIMIVDIEYDKDSCETADFVVSFKDPEWGSKVERYKKNHQSWVDKTKSYQSRKKAYESDLKFNRDAISVMKIDRKELWGKVIRSIASGGSYDFLETRKESLEKELEDIQIALENRSE